MHDATNVLHPQRTIVELKELRALTGNDDGAQRVAFTPIWENAREWLKGKMAELPVESHTDAEGNVSVTWERIWQIEPVLFDPTLIDLCDEAILETCGTSHRMPSGPLHDAAEVSRAGIPTVMMFVQSLHGISHNKIEDTRE